MRIAPDETQQTQYAQSFVHIQGILLGNQLLLPFTHVRDQQKFFDGAFTHDDDFNKLNYEEKQIFSIEKGRISYYCETKVDLNLTTTHRASSKPSEDGYQSLKTQQRIKSHLFTHARDSHDR
jgi:hypothetical protein